MAESGKKMETIQETMEMDDRGLHALLQKSVLDCLFSYLTISELKIARRVCLSWREWATPYLQNLSIVRLKGTCDFCKSEWNVKKKLPHDHRETISLYRFVTQLHALTPGERERLFFRNFILENINLYLIGRLNTDCTAYFLRLAKYFGSKVFQLQLINVQLCPSDSLKTLMAMFRNVDSVTVDTVQVWQDPLFPCDESSRILPPAANMLMTRISFRGDCSFEIPLDWQGILQQCPSLKEIELEEVKISHVNAFLAALSLFTLKQFERLRLRKISLLPRNYPLEELIENGVEETSLNDVTLSINKIPWASALEKILQSVPLTELRLRLPYSDDSYDVILALQGVTNSLSSLSLHRASFVTAAESEIIFKTRPWEITQENWIQLPFVHKLEISHNLVESLDEIKNVFPALEKLSVLVVPTEVRGGKGKPYLTYLHTNLILSMKNASAIPNVNELEWNVKEARDKEGRRTVVYRSRAIKHIPRIFPNLVSLKVSISDPTELQCIFRHLNSLEQLTLLSNSLYRIKDEDICGDTDVLRSASGLPRVTTDVPIGHGIRQLRHLKRLSLENNNSHLTDRSISHGLTGLRYLRSLHICNGKQLTFRGLRILRRCRYLVYVNVTDVQDEGLRITHIQAGQVDYYPEEIDDPPLPFTKTSEQVDLNLGQISKIPTPISKIPTKKSRIPKNSSQGGLLPILVTQKPMKATGTEKKIEDFVLPPLTQYPTSTAPPGDADQHEAGLRELERLWKKRQEKVIKKGGKYEFGNKNYKLGGRRYDYIRTTYKVNGRTYQLVRRTYEDDQGDKICAKHRAWRERQRRKQLQADLDALSEISDDPEELGSEGDSDSDYERSIREYDEDDDLEEYCDDDDDAPPVLSQSSGHTSDSDEGTFEEEGFCTDDSRYEADKEFYDSSPVEESGGESDNSEKQLSEASLDKGFVSESSTSGQKKKPKKKLRFEEFLVQSYEEPEFDNEAEPEADEEDSNQLEKSLLQNFEELELQRLEESESHRFDGPQMGHCEERRLSDESNNDLFPDDDRFKDLTLTNAIERKRLEEIERIRDEELAREREFERERLEDIEREREVERERLRAIERERELERERFEEMERERELERERFEEIQRVHMEELKHVRTEALERENFVELERARSRSEIIERRHLEDIERGRNEKMERECSEKLERARAEILERERFQEIQRARTDAIVSSSFDELEHALPVAMEHTRFQELRHESYEESEIDHFEESERASFTGSDRTRFAEVERARFAESASVHFAELERAEYEDTEQERFASSERAYFGESERKIYGRQMELDNSTSLDRDRHDESELECFEGSTSGDVYESTYERIGDSDVMHLKESSESLDSPYANSVTSEVEQFKSLESKRLDKPQVQVFEESRVKRFEESPNGRYEKSIYERFEKHKFNQREESKYERREKSKYERFSSANSERLGYFKGSPQRQSHYSLPDSLNGSPQLSLSDSPPERLRHTPQRRPLFSPQERFNGSFPSRIRDSPQDHLRGSPQVRMRGSPQERIHGSPLARQQEYERSNDSIASPFGVSGDSRNYEGALYQPCTGVVPHAQVSPSYMERDSYKYHHRRSAPIKAYREIDFEPFSRRVHSHGESRRESLESSSEYNPMQPLPIAMQHTRHFEPYMLPWEESKNGSNSESSGAKNGASNGSGSGSRSGSGSQSNFSNGNKSNRSNSNTSLMSAKGGNSLEEPRDDPGAPYTPEPEESQAEEEEQEDPNEQFHSDEDFDKPEGRKSSPTEKPGSSTRTSSIEKASRTASASSQASIRSHDSSKHPGEDLPADSIVDEAPDEEKPPIKVPCLNPEDRHHLESSF